MAAKCLHDKHTYLLLHNINRHSYCHAPAGQWAVNARLWTLLYTVWTRGVKGQIIGITIYSIDNGHNNDFK